MRTAKNCMFVALFHDGPCHTRDDNHAMVICWWKILEIIQKIKEKIHLNLLLYFINADIIY